MSKDLEYFKDFLANPESYNIRDFYSIICEWAEYTIAHKDEFNYLEDEEWREIRERVLHALEIKEDLKEEFENIKFKLGFIEKLTTDADKITVYKEWLEFMKKYQFEYDFPDEAIASSEANLNKFIISVLDCEVADERLKGGKMRLEQSIKDLENSLFEHYQRTGKRPVLSALQFKNRNRGN